MPFFWAVRMTSQFQRLMGLSFLSAEKYVIGFHLASPHVRTPPKENLVVSPYSCVFVGIWSPVCVASISTVI